MSHDPTLVNRDLHHVDLYNDSCANSLFLAGLRVTNPRIR